MAPHSNTLAWKIPWTEEPGRLQSMRSLRVRHDWVTSHSLFTFTHWRRKWQPTPVFLPGESQGWGSWWAAVYGVTQSQTRLKWLSSSSRSSMVSQTWRRKWTFRYRKHRVPNKMNPNRATPRHIIIKIAKVKEKEKILKEAREKQRGLYNGIPISLLANFSTEKPTI